MTPITTIGLIGDVHCEPESLKLAIDTLQKQDVQTIVCTGDIPTGPGDVNVCCELLHRHKVLTICGNHDRWLRDLTVTNLPHATHPSVVSKASWRFLYALPATAEIETSAGPAQLCHGMDREDMLSILPEQSDLELDEHPFLQALVESQRFRWIINGHSHRRMVRRYGPLTIINAGTLRRDHDPCFAMIDFAKLQVRFWNIVNQQAAPTETFPLE